MRVHGGGWTAWRSARFKRFVPLGIALFFLLSSCASFILFVVPSAFAQTSAVQQATSTSNRTATVMADLNGRWQVQRSSAAKSGIRSISFMPENKVAIFHTRGQMLEIFSGKYSLIAQPDSARIGIVSTNQLVPPVTALQVDPEQLREAAEGRGPLLFRRFDGDPISATKRTTAR